MWYKHHCYICRLSLDKTRTVIGQFLVTCPSRPGNNSAVFTRSGCFGLLKEKSKYVTKHSREKKKKRKKNCFPRDYTLKAHLQPTGFSTVCFCYANSRCLSQRIDWMNFSFGWIFIYENCSPARAMPIG